MDHISVWVIAFAIGLLVHHFFYLNITVKDCSKMYFNIYTGTLKQNIVIYIFKIFL